MSLTLLPLFYMRTANIGCFSCFVCCSFAVLPCIGFAGHGSRTGLTAGGVWNAGILPYFHRKWFNSDTSLARSLHSNEAWALLCEMPAWMDLLRIIAVYDGRFTSLGFVSANVRPLIAAISRFRIQETSMWYCTTVSTACECSVLKKHL